MTCMELWPLLTEDLLTGAYSIERQLRPRVTAVAVRSGAMQDLREVVGTICTRWGGGFSPLISVDPDAAKLDDRVARALLGSNIDGLEGRKLLSKDIEQRYSDRFADAAQWLLRQVAYVKDQNRPIVQTCRGVAVDNPWYPAYLVVFGDLPDVPDAKRNSQNDLRDDLTFRDVADIAEVVGEPSLRDLVRRLLNLQQMSAVELTRLRLPTSAIGGYNQGMPTTSRFTWGHSSALTQYGPNLLVVYRADSTEDLALVWNLRARFAHPNGLPLAIPFGHSTREDIISLRRTSQVQRFFGMGHNLGITSFSVSPDELNALSAGTGFDVLDPWDVVGEVYGCGVASTEMAQFVDGNATVPSFSPTDIETLGQHYLGSSDATWLTLTTVVSECRLPPSPSMRRTRWQEPGYLHGKVVHVGKLDEFATLRQPAGLEVLRALTRDHSLQARVSTPGKAAENLMRAARADLSMFAYPGVNSLLEGLARRGHASLVKRRLNQFLEGTDVIPGSEKYEILAARLDTALGAPDVDEIGHMNFNKIGQTLGLQGKSFNARQTASWIDWAVRRRLILRGVQATCRNCKHVQWRPLGDAVPELECLGCGLPIHTPFGSQKIDYQYRASEILLRAVEHDVLPHVLSIRHIAEILGRRMVFGAYPGIELMELGGKEVVAEFDVVVILTNGRWIVGECKVSQRGLKESELQKLWATADRVEASATFVATLDRGSECSDLWRERTDPNGRPHFALTAGQLYDLAAYQASYGGDLFGWREDLVRLLPDAELTQEGFVHKAFGDYLLHRTDDPSKRQRAPWDVD
ncbi:hypothetical protein [Mycobacterium gordonae]|uniref:hypothetical protein n=1 Tax=Mycobacterium gordonae TaxID=1778 RepID=UPI0012EA46EC|nr:hypothetical protein [Mycobacterium gordonae]MCV7004425.1 hypothetical protein [Mycobacterium gordonae]